MSEEPKKVYVVNHGGSQTSFYEWQKDEAENDYSFWKEYYDMSDNVVILFKDGVAVKKVTYTTVVTEEIL